MNKFKKLLAIGGLIASISSFAQCNVSNLSAWSLTLNTDSKLDVTAGSSMSGTDCGLEVTVDHDNRHYVQDDSPVTEQRYRGAFCIDPNTIAMPDSGTFRRMKVMNVRCPGAGAGGTCPFRQVMQMKLQKTPTSYSIKGFVRDGAGLPNNGSSKNAFSFDLADAPSRVEWDLDITSNKLRVWVNASAEGDAPTIDKTVDLSQWTSGVDSLRVGGLNMPTSIVETATIHLDNVETRRQTFIGGSCN